MQNLFKDYHFKLKLFSFLALLIIIFYRSPYILVNSRFVSEEGYLWFRNSYIEGPIYGLFQIFWNTGYFNLWANIGSVLALITAIETALETDITRDSNALDTEVVQVETDEGITGIGECTNYSANPALISGMESLIKPLVKRNLKLKILVKKIVE